MRDTRPVNDNIEMLLRPATPKEKIEDLLTTVQTNVLFEIELANGKRDGSPPRNQNER